MNDAWDIESKQVTTETQHWLSGNTINYIRNNVLIKWGLKE